MLSFIEQDWARCSHREKNAISSCPSRPAIGRAQYWREIATVLSLKTFAFCLLYLLCFGPGNSMDPSAATMFRHLVSPIAPGSPESAHD
jgi:hypothetical protein